MYSYCQDIRAVKEWRNSVDVRILGEQRPGPPHQRQIRGRHRGKELPEKAVVPPETAAAKAGRK